ncbi:MAG TPA: dTMP kinase [Miltoncostaeaceae bacterium]|nr:dTMP kinase [Miltoncostaeaceae bacterium]
MSAARFVTLEGTDGSGKTTQARMLAAALRAAGRAVTETREPGGTPLGEALRALLLDAPHAPVPAAEVHLFAAARAQLVARVVRPALARGEWVVCDRFLDSSLAYQGVARGLGVEAVYAANRLAVGDCLPHLTLLIETPGDVAAARRGRGGADRIEAEGDDLQARVAAGYAEVAALFPERVRRVDGTGTPEQVHQRVMAALGPR